MNPTPCLFRPRNAAEAWLNAMRSLGGMRTLEEWSRLLHERADDNGISRGISGAALSARFRREFGADGEFAGEAVKVERPGMAPVYGLKEFAT